MKYFEKQSMSENIKALIVSLYYHNIPALTLYYTFYHTKAF